MGFTNRTNPYQANAFTSNPPTGSIVPFTSNVAFTGFISGPASYGFSVSSYEAAGKAYLVFNRMYGAVLPLSMDYHTGDGSAVAGVDYTAVSGTLNWAAFDIAAKVVQVPLLRTTKIINQSFNFFVGQVYVTGSFFHSGAYYFKGGNLNPFPGSSYAGGPGQFPVSFPVTIIRPTNGEADFVGSAYQVLRPGGTSTLTVQVQRFNGFRGAATVNFHTTDGTAIAGIAYTAISGTLSWADGEGGTKNIVITIKNGGAGSQSFTVTIDTPTGGIVIGSIPVATVTIVAAAPNPTPVAGGSIPNQLVDEVAPYTDSFRWNHPLLTDEFFGFFRSNLLYQGMLGQKIGTVIGFSGGTAGNGGGTDPTDGPGPLTQPFGKFKYQGYVN